VPGNSVPYYYRAILAWESRSDGERQEFFQLMDDINEKPLSDLLEPKLKARIEQATSTYALDNLKYAVYRDHTIWDWQVERLQDQAPYSFIIQETQSTRGLSRLIDVKTRLLAAEGRYEEAIELHKQHFKLARDVAQQPFLIPTLVAFAQVSISSYNLKDIITQTDCPNLYWALATLPDPFISINPALEYESTMPEMMFPVLRNPAHTEHSTAEWARLMRNMVHSLNQYDDGWFEYPETGRELVGAGMLVRSYPVAKRELAAQGWNRDELEKMPVGQVVAIYQKQTTRRIYDDFMKWSYTSYQERHHSERFQADQERFQHEKFRMREPFPIATLLLPAVRQAKEAEARMTAKIKGLMVLEAIRMHAAENDGRLPESLAEITVVPVPDECPLTGEPYEYQFKDGVASLIVPSMPEKFGRKYWWEFQLKNSEPR